jgi:hypothetical protein
MPLTTAGKNLLLGQAIALQVVIATADTAVIAVVLAVVCKFDQPSDIDMILIIFTTDLIRSAKQLLVSHRGNFIVHMYIIS